MDLEGIPKTFWHAASFALVAFTIGFLFISYKYGDLTVKFNDLEVRTSNTVVLESSLKKQEESVRAQAEIIAQREQEVKDLKALLDKRIKELDEVKQELAGLQNDDAFSLESPLTEKLRRVSIDDSLAKAFQSKTENLESLQQKQDIQKQVYDNQRSFYETQQQIQQQWVAPRTNQ